VKVVSSETRVAGFFDGDIALDAGVGLSTNTPQRFPILAFWPKLKSYAQRYFWGGRDRAMVMPN